LYGGTKIHGGAENYLGAMTQARHCVTLRWRLLFEQERHQQLICQQVNSSSSVSETGGWCDTAVRVVHVTDRPLATALAHLFTARSVVGLGDGRGEYRRLILASGHVTRYDAFDGAPNIRNITGGQVENVAVC